MGVRGLQTLMKQNNLLTEIYLQDEAVKYRYYHRCSEDYQVLVVVDALSFLRYWHGNRPWIYGGQWYKIKERIAYFIQRFTNLGLKLVFFFDGTVDNVKRRTWCKRRLQEREDSRKFFDALIAGDGHLPKSHSNVFSLPPNMSGFVKYLLKYEFCQTMVASIGEGDRAMAEYAVRNKCLAILSDDSDFVIYDSVPCYSGDMLDLEHMYTLCYNRDYLCHYLGIDPKYLPILAALSGTDIVPSEELKGFHEQIRPLGRFTSVICNVAGFLHDRYLGRHVGWRRVSCRDLVHQLERDMPALAELNFASAVQVYLFTLYRDEAEFEQRTLDLVRERKLARVSDTVFRDVVRCHIACDMPPTVLATLMAVDSDIGTSLEDVRSGLPPYGDLYKALRCRMSGFMLQVTPQECAAQSVWINEWNMSSVSVDEHHSTRLHLQPVLINGSVCTVGQVWSGADDLKWTVFWRIMGLPDQLVNQKMPVGSDMCCVLAVLHYLYTALVTTGHMQRWEIELILLHVFTVRSMVLSDEQTTANRSNNTASDVINPRAVTIPTLLCRGVGQALSVLSLCRLQSHIAPNLPWHHFNGAMFHSLYIRAAAATARDTNPALEELVRDCHESGNIMKDVKRCMKFLESSVP